MRLLLRRGASPTRSNKDGVSPVDLAQDKVLPEVYSLLMQVRGVWGSEKVEGRRGWGQLVGLVRCAATA